jgi:hypothetical protein
MSDRVVYRVYKLSSINYDKLEPKAIINHDEQIETNA